MARFTRSAEVAERRTNVLALRIEHRTYAEIGAALGISPKLAEADYRRALGALKREQDAQAHLNVAAELARYDAAEREAWQFLRADRASTLVAIDRILRIAERRARLLGLDAPTRVEVSDAVDAELQRLAAELAVMEPGGEAAAAGGAAPGEGRTAAP